MKKLVVLFLALLLLCSTAFALAEDAADTADNNAAAYVSFDATIIPALDCSAEDFYASASNRAMFTLIASLEANDVYGQYLIDPSKASYVGYADGYVMALFFDGSDYICIIYYDAVPDQLTLLPCNNADELFAEQFMIQTDTVDQYEKNETSDLAEVAQTLTDIFSGN